MSGLRLSGRPQLWVRVGWIWVGWVRAGWSRVARAQAGWGRGVASRVRWGRLGSVGSGRSPVNVSHPPRVTPLDIMAAQSPKRKNI
jgi:hypothetical protein